MKILSLSFLLAGAVAVASAAEGNLDQALDKAALDYTERLRKAAGELAATRARLDREKLPLLTAQRAAEDRLLAAESLVTQQQMEEQQAVGRRNNLGRAAATWQKNSAYAATLAQDGLKTYSDSLAPGEEQSAAAQLAEIRMSFDNRGAAPAALLAANAADFLLGRVQQSLGGYAIPGSATVGEGNEVKNGMFAFVGPQTFFRADDGTAGVVVRLREGGVRPVAYPVSAWLAADSSAFFQGNLGNIPADGTGTKALRLEQTTGTLWQHIEKGGYVAYAILAAGCLAIALIILKLVDAARLKVDEPARVRDFLRRVSTLDNEAAQVALGSFRPVVRELFAVGLQHRDDEREALEERLQAVLLHQRLHFERRLPLLAVIATAAPLMGLLGTVVGMVKTFALITVFGTGNAGKLASGISEVLVATELGLAVAIPALVIHGFLSQRIQGRLAVLERYALEFMTAVRPVRVEASVR